MQQHKQDKNKKCNFLFEDLILDIPTILRKHYFGTNWHYLLRRLPCRTKSRIFPISRQKAAHRKNAPKNAPKTHRKTENVHRIFPPNFSPNFRCVFFCSKNSKCHRKTASKKFSQKIHRGTEQNPECRCGRGGSLSTCPFEKQNFSRKTENFAVLHLSAFQLFVFLNMPPKHYKNWKSSEK